MKRSVTSFLALVLLVAALVVLAQQPFDSSKFEYQQYQPHHGIIELWPYPMLIEGGQIYLLADVGKHGFDTVAESSLVSLKGARIERAEGQMLEVQEGSVLVEGPAAQSSAPYSLGEVALHGEIVDTKCFLGVMNPGRGKVHRECAARCISGGLPPALLVREGPDASRIVLLTGRDGRKLNREILDYVAEPLLIRGELVRVDQSLVLKAEPRDFRRE